MTNYIKRFIFIDASETTKINPLVWPFLLAVLIYGLGFAFGSAWSGVSSSSLYTSLDTMHHWLPQIWGVGAALAGGLPIIGIALRRASLSETATMFGFLVWLFAAIVYGMGGYWLVLVTVTGPHLWFWVYFYMRTKWYEREKRSGKLIDPE